MSNTKGSNRVTSQENANRDELGLAAAQIVQDPATKSRKSLTEENIAAQIAAAEAIAIGRETTEASARQAEQIAKTDELADQTHYKLDRSARLLRGMTWGGWFANVFSSDVVAPNPNATTARMRQSASFQLKYPSAESVQYADIPEKFQKAAQAVKNYRCNLLILEHCNSPEERTMCSSVCNQLHDVATEELSKLQFRDLDQSAHDSSSREVYEQLVRDLTESRDVQKRLERRDGGINADSELFISSNDKGRIDTLPVKSDELSSEYDEHLSILSKNLSELKYLGESLGQSFHDQNEVLESLGEKSDSLIDKTKLVTRRADRLTQRARWKALQPEFDSWVSMQHIETGLYLTESNGSVKLDSFHPQFSVFGLWKRKEGSLFGLQNRLTRKWVGQTLMGYISCSASAYGPREDWEINEENQLKTPLLCASANWGNGGWISVRRKDGTLTVGGSDLDAKNKADLWRFTVQQL